MSLSLSPSALHLSLVCFSLCSLCICTLRETDVKSKVKLARALKAPRDNLGCTSLSTLGLRSGRKHTHIHTLQCAESRETERDLCHAAGGESGPVMRENESGSNVGQSCSRHRLLCTTTTTCMTSLAHSLAEQAPESEWHLFSNRVYRADDRVSFCDYEYMYTQRET